MDRSVIEKLLKEHSQNVGRGNIIQAHNSLDAIIRSILDYIDENACSGACGCKDVVPPLPEFVTKPAAPVAETAPAEKTEEAKRGRGRPKKS